MQLPGNKFTYENRNERKGVELYIKDSKEHKVVMTSTKLMKLRHMWAECKGNNCNKSYLIEVLHQLSPDEREKLIWREKLDTILSAITSTWNKTIIITGDTNIEYIKSSVAFTQYKVIFQTYYLKQHITVTTRKNT